MSTQNSPLGFTAEQERAARLFYPYALEKSISVMQKGTRFVYYTSADTAMKIISHHEAWMRKSSCMNDFMEIEHGVECLCSAYKNNKNTVERVFNTLFPGFCSRLEGQFNGWLDHFRTDTYLTCFSEHGDGEEDRIGRLSMWRAYGGQCGVAIVMNPAPFLSPSNALRAYSSPVAYLAVPDFETQFKEWLGPIAKNAAWIKGLGEDAVLSTVFNAFRFAILCTKHPGFKEEKEWRIIYNPKYEQSPRLRVGIESVNGVPQPVVKIPLRNVPEEGLTGIEIPELINRVIVGPTQYPSAVTEALVKLLEDAGVANAASRVFVSDIPLRQFD